MHLSDHFTARRLLRFTLPSIAMMIFTSIYSVVDGFFVSNFVGKTPFAAVNFIYPLIMVLSAPGFMFGAGGSALIGKTLGEGDGAKANRTFSLVVFSALGLAVLLGAGSFLLMPELAALMGAEGELLEDAVLYGRLSALGLPCLSLQFVFQSFFITAERPQLGLAVTVISGVTNMALDALFMAGFRWGVAGAAAATVTAQVVAAAVALVYFFLPNRSLLRLGKCGWDGPALFKTLTNGSSELMSNVSMSLVSMLYNIQLLRYAGEDGVSAYGVLMYVTLIFLALFIGYSQGMAPVVSYHFGARDTAELRSLLRKSLGIIAVFSVAMLVFGELMGPLLSTLFAGYDAGLYALTERAFRIYSISFLFSGLAIFGSGFFTALNDGVTSAIMSFLRTVVFQVAAVLVLPRFWGVDGIWASIVAAEFVAAAVTAAFLAGKRAKYGY
ncbi:MAG: MATE family efflux transporter [bacterium]